MSELSARLGLYAAIDQAVERGDARVEDVARVIPLYRLNSDGELPVGDRNGTAGWVGQLGELLPEGAVITDVTSALREFDSAPSPVSDLDQARRLKAIWAVARVPGLVSPGPLTEPLRPLVLSALDTGDAEPDPGTVDRNLGRLIELLTDTTRFTTAEDFSALVTEASSQALISAHVAQLASVTCEDSTVLVPVPGPSGHPDPQDPNDPAAQIITQIHGFAIGALTLDQVRAELQPLHWPHCLPSFWCSMTRIAPGEPGIFQEKVGDCLGATGGASSASGQVWFHPYLEIGCTNRPATAPVRGFRLTYDLASAKKLKDLSAGRPKALVQDSNIEVDQGKIEVDFHPGSGAGTPNVVDITTTKIIRFKRPYPTGAVALLACLSGWGDHTREMMAGCLGPSGPHEENP